MRLTFWICATAALVDLCVVPALAQVSPAQLATNRFNDCISHEIKRGGYTSRDGGESISRLLMKCADERRAFVNRCVSQVTSIRSEDDKIRFCEMMSGLEAQKTLRLVLHE
jgi:hypothetical protein